MDATPAPARSVPLVSLELYERARLAYLERPSARGVAEVVGIGRDLAQRIIDSGEPALGLPSLRDAARLLAAQTTKELARVEQKAGEEQAQAMARTLEARARAAKLARENEERLLGDAVESRKAEVRLVRANRTSALVLAGVNADLLKVSSKLAASLLRDLEKLEKLGPRERMGILRTVAGVVHRTAQASQVAVNMERLLMGEPTAILGRSDGGGPSTADMTVEEAEQWLSLATRAFERRARRRQVIDAQVVPQEGGEAEGEDVLELVEDLAP